MIKCNLSVLLAEKNLKITKVANDTKISRTTLTALAYNRSQGIQFDTLNILCHYLNVTPDQLLSFVPVSIMDFTSNLSKSDTFNLIDVTISMKILDHGEFIPCSMNGFISLYFEKENEPIVTGILVFLGLLDENEEDPTIKLKNRLITTNFEKLPRSTLFDLKDNLDDVIFESIKKFIGNEISEEVWMSIDWPFDDGTTILR